MEDIVRIDRDDNGFTVTFYIENDTVMEIGEKLTEICEDAYMNGYNWEAVLNAYLDENAPDTCELMETDPEAGLFAAYFEPSEEGKAAANNLAEIIRGFINEPQTLYDFVSENAEDIEWD